MSHVLCRFQLQEVRRIPYYTGKEEITEATSVKFIPVQGEPFGPATPQGQFEALIVNPTAAKVFLTATIGQPFNILIEAVPPEE
jgi:hypothetical protein